MHIDEASKALIKRKSICVALGLVFGLVCCALAASGGEVKVWGTPLMWAILWNRMLIGIFIFIAGVLNYHAMFKFRIFPWLRGAVLGLVVSIGPAISSMIGGEFMPKAVWGTMVMGAVYGLIIDVVATKLAGDGQALLGDWCK